MSILRQGLQKFNGFLWKFTMLSKLSLKGLKFTLSWERASQKKPENSLRKWFTIFDSLWSVGTDVWNRETTVIGDTLLRIERRGLIKHSLESSHTTNGSSNSNLAKFLNE